MASSRSSASSETVATARSDNRHLEHAPGFEQVRRFLLVGGGHEGAMVAPALHDAFALEDIDRAARHGPADPEMLRDHVFEDLHPRSKRTLSDRERDRIAHPFADIVAKTCVHHLAIRSLQFIGHSIAD